MTMKHTNGRLLLAASVPMLPMAFAMARRHDPGTVTGTLHDALPFTLAIAFVAVLFSFIASIMDDFVDDTWTTASGFCLAVCGVAVFSFNGALFFALFTSTVVNVFTLMTVGMFALATLLSVFGIGALFGNGIGVSARTAMLLFAGQCVLMGYLQLHAHKTVASLLTAAAAAAMLFGLRRVRALPASTRY